MQKIILLILTITILVPLQTKGQNKNTANNINYDAAYTPAFIAGAGYITGGYFAFEMGLQFTNNLGMYISGYVKPNSKSSDIYGNITYNYAKFTLEDTEMGNNNVYIGYGAGVELLIYDKLYLDMGLQYQTVEKYTKFYDRFHILGTTGIYYVSRGKEANIGGEVQISYNAIRNWYLKAGYIFGEFSGTKILVACNMSSFFRY